MLFLQHVGQTSPFPLGLEIVKAQGIYFYDNTGKQYIDLVSGVSVSNVGHSNKIVIDAIKQQADKYLHLMVYGEFIQEPQVNFAKRIIEQLPEPFESVYFVNSGSEAVEGAMKLAKRITGRRQILAFKNAYHGSTHGALSIYGGNQLNQSVQPLLPEVGFMEFNNISTLDAITNKTACVVMEVIQSEAGIIWATNEFLQAVKQKCTETGTILVFDEIQTGFGRTGKMFGFEHYQILPDIICMAKSMGGGMPIGAFVSSKKHMDMLTYNPALGHLTTFGGHPVSCAAGLAALNIIIDDNLCKISTERGNRFKQKLKHKAIDHIRGEGLFLAVELKKQWPVIDLLKECIDLGVVFDPFLFTTTSFRIGPPLTITNNEVDMVCELIIKALDRLEPK